MMFYVGIGSWDHEGDYFEDAQFCLSKAEAEAAIDADYKNYDDYNVYRCQIGTAPVLVSHRSRKGKWTDR